MRETWLIGVNVLRQLLRNRILVVLFLFSLGLIGVALFLGDLGQETQVRLSRDFGLLAIEWVGFFTVLVCHLVLLFEETELKTISILFVKPIKRWHYMLGKIFGSLLLLGLNQLSMVGLLAGLAWWRGQPLVDWAFCLAAAYLFVSLALFSVVTLFFSIYASTVPACAVYATFAFGIGHFTSNLLDWVKRMDRPGLEAMVKVLYVTMPNFGLFNFKDNLDAVNLNVLQPGMLLWPVAYALSYGGALLAISLWRYERKEY
jgi:ABC-type transport system involved in multi-copper enzyme maturation permease subunit